MKVLHRRGVGAIELVDRRTAWRLIRAVGRYLADHPDIPSVRIDAVAVLSDGGAWPLEH